MNLAYKQDVSFIKIGEDRYHVAGLLKLRTRRNAYFDAHFMCYKPSERSLAKASRPVEQNVIERFLSRTSRLIINLGLA